MNAVDEVAVAGVLLHQSFQCFNKDTDRAAMPWH
jgi:hypothetical protein